MNRVSYIDFQHKLSPFGVFSVQDIRKVYPSFDTRRLCEWQKKTYIKKLVNTWYQFATLPPQEEVLWWKSNRLARPSYISLETALSYYGFIPEGVFAITAITTSKPRRMYAGENAFIYQNVKPQLFFGYKIIHYNNWPITFAEPEKAILDYLYLNPALNTLDDIKSLRLNKGQILSLLHQDTLLTYLQVFHCKALNKRFKLLEKFLNA